MPAKVFTDKDADLGVLQNKILAVLGFGSQGHAHALNLKDSGLTVLIGLYEGSKSIPVAEEKGFEVVSTADAVRRADIIFLALPDTKQPSIYQRDIAPNLIEGKTLLFSHGFSIHFKTVVPPKGVNVILVAPKGPGHIVRRQYLEGKGVPALIGVYQDPSKQAKKAALAWAKGIGATRAGVIATTFREETETDLFGEQTKKRMKAALKDIQSGKFARGWVAEYKGGYKKYNALLKKSERHSIEKTGARLRGLMPWMQKRSIKGAQAAY